MTDRFQSIVKNIESRTSTRVERSGCELLERILSSKVLEDMPFFKTYGLISRRVIVVAGTNGKGSVCAMMEAMLRANGHSVGMFTSPHLVDVRERIQVNREMISHDQFVQAYDIAVALAGEIELTRFELFTLMALIHFASGKIIPPVDYMILEIGIGGTKDAVNAIPHGLCVVTPIGRDHTEILGSSLEEIAEQKFGIVNEPSHQLLVYSPRCPRGQIPMCREVKEARLLPFITRKESGEPKTYLVHEEQHWPLSLLGERAAENASLALSVFEVLGGAREQGLAALKEVQWPGRMQKLIVNSKKVFLSGDHNSMGIRSLCNLLQDFEYENLWLVVGIGKNKDSEEMLSLLSSLPRVNFVLTQTTFKARSDYSHTDKEYISDPDQAFLSVLNRMTPKDILVVTGSLYLVGHILSVLTSNVGERTL